MRAIPGMRSREGLGSERIDAPFETGGQLRSRGEPRLRFKEGRGQIFKGEGWAGGMRAGHEELHSRSFANPGFLITWWQGQVRTKALGVRYCPEHVPTAT